jgi:hypothetical protein
VQSNSICGQEEKTCLFVERVAEVVGVEAPSGRRGGAVGGSCKHKYPPAPRAPGGGRRGGRLWGPAAAEGNGLGRERGAGDEARSTNRRSRHAHESRARQGTLPARSHRPRRRRKTAGGDVRAAKSRINQAQQVTCANLLLCNAN